MIDREWQATLKAVWQSVASFFVLLCLTVVAHVRPEWVQTALALMTMLALWFVVIGLQLPWRIKHPF